MITKKFSSLTPTPDRIAELYGIDQKRAKAIHEMLKAVEDATRELIIVQEQIVREQAEFIEQQAETADLIERQLGRERDALTIIRNLEVMLTGKPVSVQFILAEIFVPVVAEALEKLEPTEKDELFVALSIAISSLKKFDKEKNDINGPGSPEKDA